MFDSRDIPKIINTEPLPFDTIQHEDVPITRESLLKLNSEAGSTIGTVSFTELQTVGSLLNNKKRYRRQRPKQNTIFQQFKIERSKKWSNEQLKKFYQCLQMFGADFSMIAKLMENRSRIEVMNKFKKEDKQKKAEIERSLQRHKRKRLSKHFSRKNSLRKESLVSVNSLDSSDIRVVNEVRKIIMDESEVKYMEYNEQNGLEN